MRDKRITTPQWICYLVEHGLQPRSMSYVQGDHYATVEGWTEDKSKHFTNHYPTKNPEWHSVRLSKNDIDNPAITNGFFELTKPSK